MSAAARNEQMNAFREMAGRVLEIAIREGMTTTSDGEVRRGGWLYILEGWDLPAVAYKRQLGEVPETSRSRDRCVEKAWRVRRLHAISSSAERDVERGQYLGAVHLDVVNLTASFSGLPEEADEAVMLVAGTLCGFITGLRCAEIIAASGNKLVEPLLAICHRELMAA